MKSSRRKGSTKKQLVTSLREALYQGSGGGSRGRMPVQGLAAGSDVGPAQLHGSASRLGRATALLASTTVSAGGP